MLRKLGLVFWLLGMATVEVVTQANTGEIGGLVVDGSGGVLPGATIIASHPDSGLRVERVTDSQGRFFLPALPTGRWEVVAELPGFQRAVQRLSLIHI